MSSSLFPLKTRPAEGVEYVEIRMSSLWCGVEVRRRMSAQMLTSSLDLRSKLRGPLPIALEWLNSATKMFTRAKAIATEDLSRREADTR
ncbi:hypothetical protein TNCV_932371 [Trichonephila clavipes]|nr:hypothetical protein TNCV_932371 [Trichonephila clavipes]